MTPEQLLLVEESLTTVKPRLDDVAADFYRRLFALEPGLIRLFVTDPVQQRAKFVEQLYAIMSSIRELDVFLAQASDMGVRHEGYGASAADYQAAGTALLGALGAELGPAWTPELERAWLLAYNITAEAMMAVAATRPTGRGRRRAPEAPIGQDAAAAAKATAGPGTEARWRATDDGTWT